jgi:hypothetical protein
MNRSPRQICHPERSRGIPWIPAYSQIDGLNKTGKLISEQGLTIYDFRGRDVTRRAVAQHLASTPQQINASTPQQQKYCHLEQPAGGGMREIYSR